MSSHSSTSSSITGVCGSAPLPTSASPIPEHTSSGAHFDRDAKNSFAPVPQLKLGYLAPTLLARFFHFATWPELLSRRICPDLDIQRLKIFVRKRLILKAIDDPRMVHNL